MFLDGWVLASSEPASDDPTDDGIIDDSSASEIDILFEETSESLDDADYNKIITADEVNHFYQVAKADALSYLGYPSTTILDASLQHFLYMWTAGEIYRKYDIRPTELMDETYPVGYGDQLIISAKTGLKPYKKYRISIF